jgi:prepilin-type processing-associated H-X9-DG protein
LYFDDNEKRFPQFGSSQRVVFPDNPESDFWDFNLLPYAGGNKAVFMCGAMRGTNSDPEINWSCRDGEGVLWPNRSFGYNAAGVGVEPLSGDPLTWFTSMGLSSRLELGYGASNVKCLSEQKLVAPSDMIAVVDYDPSITDDADGDWHSDAVYALTLTGKRHDGRANVLFCDAHIECIYTNVLKAPEARVRWNYDHQPHPDAYPFFPVP